MLDSIKIQLDLITNQYHKQTMDILQTVKDSIHANDVQSGTLHLATLELKLKEYTSSEEK